MTSFAAPRETTYDVVIVGGAIFGSSIAWFLASNPDFDGKILVVEMDPTYENSSTAHTNSCMRQQFSAEINVKVSQFAAEFVKNFRSFLGDDERVPDLHFQSYGYMYLADTPEFANALKELQKIQEGLGSHTKYMTADEIAQAYPFYDLDGILGGNHNLVDEGYFDAGTMFDWWRRSAREKGVEFLTNKVVGMTKSADGTRVEAIELASGETVGCGTVVNASGPRAVLTSRMAGIDIPVEPRKRYTFVFSAEKNLDRDLPLTIDPSGIHMRSDGANYMAGCPPEIDVAVDYDDFQEDHSVWEERVWPLLAQRVPQFEAIRLQNSWAGHYAFNVFDHNAIIGAHSEVANFIFANGFSGHGLQQSPAMGRGVSELITYGEYRTLDLTPFAFERIAKGERFVEKAII